MMSLRSRTCASWQHDDSCRTSRRAIGGRRVPRVALRWMVMTLLATVVATSGQVAATPARSAKIRLLAECLRDAQTEELEIVVLYLSGEIRQGRIGIGPSLQLPDV